MIKNPSYAMALKRIAKFKNRTIIKNQALSRAINYIGNEKAYTPEEAQATLKALREAKK